MTAVGSLRLPGCSAVAVLTTLTTRKLLESRTDGQPRRLNFRGSSVPLSGGPATAMGLLTGMVAGGAPAGSVLSVAGAGVAGWYDDRASSRADEAATKGFAGHLRSVKRGSASAGLVKLGLIGATSLAGAAFRTGASVDTLIDGGIVAGSANLVNLFDLRPGRALKVVALAAGLSAPGCAAEQLAVLASISGTVAAGLPADLAERSMLGDTGANAIGAALGSVLCGRSRTVRLGLLGGIVALTALSERVSFTAVIAGNPLLRRLDELGRAVA